MVRKNVTHQEMDIAILDFQNVFHDKNVFITVAFFGALLQYDKGTN